MADAFMLPLGNPLLFGSMAANSFSQIVIDANNDAAEWIYQAEAPVPITRLGFRLSGRTGTPGNFKISLQGGGCLREPEWDDQGRRQSGEQGVCGRGR